ncbi:MAG: diacylglycerol/lipid kinase family protein, partial [Cellulosimicrobium funkei]
MAWTLWVAIAALAVAVVALVVALGLRAQQSRLRRAHGADLPVEETPPDDDPRELVAFVANPSKPDVGGLGAGVRRAVADAARPDPRWFETTIADPGVGQTRAALAQGADVVVAVGGDGTVRAVAEGMVGSGRTMGLVPVGTGNLLARNLDLPVGDARAALAVVIAGSDRPIDVGWVTVLRYADPAGPGDVEGTTLDPVREPGKEHIFLVIAGLGFDAAMVADADDELKANVGWVAYFVAG